MATTVRDILRHLETLAPPALAESWDNVGLLIGDAAASVSTVLVALDATTSVLDQAAAVRAECLVTHHPLLFSGVKRLTEDGGVTTLIRRVVRAGCSLIAMHTNLDSAPQGLNTHVAGLLGLRDTAPLLPTAARPLLKLVVYVPADHVDAVRAAVCAAGAGHIGGYDACTFGAPGTGTFRPGAGTHPFIGTPGTLERVEEIRLETVVPRAALGRVLEALQRAHPYEEVAYDLLALDNPWPDAGLGRIGTLPEPVTLQDFAARVGVALHTDRLAVTGDLSRPISKVALCTGSGSEYADAARRQGADVYLTGEVKHHHALLAADTHLALIDAGHYPTERPAAALMADYLRARIPGVQVIVAEEEDPLAHWG